MQAQQSTLSIMRDLPVTHSISEEFESRDDQQERERDLIERCQNGDVKAMEAIVHQYQTQVYNSAYGMLGNREDAQDLVQEVFLRVWEKIGQFEFKSRFSTWLYRIVMNQCINEKNRRKRHKTVPMEMDDTQSWTPVHFATPEHEALLAEKRELLEIALGQLREDYRAVLVLREMENLSYEELAEALNCSLGRVKSRLHEARMALRQILERLDR